MVDDAATVVAALSNAHSHQSSVFEVLGARVPRLSFRSAAVAILPSPSVEWMVHAKPLSRREGPRGPYGPCGAAALPLAGWQGPLWSPDPRMGFLGGAWPVTREADKSTEASRFGACAKSKRRPGRLPLWRSSRPRSCQGARSATPPGPYFAYTPMCHRRPPQRCSLGLRPHDGRERRFDRAARAPGPMQHAPDGGRLC